MIQPPVVQRTSWPICGITRRVSEFKGPGERGEGPAGEVWGSARRAQCFGGQVNSTSNGLDTVPVPAGSGLVAEPTIL